MQFQFHCDILQSRWALHGSWKESPEIAKCYNVFQTIFPTSPDTVKVLTLFIKSFIVDNGKGYRIVSKPLARGQSFTTMCGYITKDEGQPWYQCRVHNIPREDLQQGRLQHISAQTAIDDGKVILTQRNFFTEIRRKHKL